MCEVHFGLLVFHFWVENHDMSCFIKKVLSDVDIGALTGVTCVLPKCKAKDGNALACYCLKKSVENLLHKWSPLVVVHCYHLIPVFSHLR